MSFKNTNLNDYQFKSSRYNWGSTYMSPMEITNQKCIIDTQKPKRKEVKPTTKKSSNHNGKKQKRKMNKEIKTKKPGKQGIKGQ